MSHLAASQSSSLRHAHRAAGQAAALAAMLEEGRPFTEIAQQVLAARGSLDALLVRVLEEELTACLPGDEQRAVVVRLLRAAVGQSGLLSMADHATEVESDPGCIHP